MTGILDFATEAQKAFDSILNHPLHGLRDDLQAWLRAQEEIRENILASAQSLGIAVDISTQKFFREFEASQKWIEKLVPEFEASQKWARELAMLASVAVPLVKPHSNVDWSVISPRPHVRTPSLDSEPSSERTIVRPEVKRKIGFRP